MFEGFLKTIGEWKDGFMSGLDEMIESIKEQFEKLSKMFTIFRFGSGFTRI